MACCCCEPKGAGGTLLGTIGAAALIWYYAHAIFVAFVVLAVISWIGFAISMGVLYFMHKHLTYVWWGHPSAMGGTVPYRVEVTGGQDGRMGAIVGPGAPRRLPAARQRASTPAEIEGVPARWVRQEIARPEPVRLHHRVRGPEHQAHQDWRD